jgi:hypothetical protein
MALWGSRDSFAITGTVDLVNTSSVVVGTSTAFTTELEVGDVIINSAGAKYKVTSIANNTYLTISPAYATANASGATITGQDAPKFLAAEGATIQAIDKVYGVDSTEAVAQTTDPGWVYVNTYTDMHGNSRVKREVLVAASSYTADAEDTVYPDVVITIGTQPSNSSANTGDAVSFTVVATTLPTGVTLNYRWQESDGANAFVNLTDTGVYANTNTATLEISDNTGLDGYVYRVQIGATGASANSVSANASIEEL